MSLIKALMILVCLRYEKEIGERNWLSGRDGNFF